MLTRDQEAALVQSLQQWTADESITKEVASMVIEIALSNPASIDSVKVYCDSHFWSPKIVEFYSRFLKYLKDGKKASNTSVKARLAQLAQELAQIAEAL